MMVEIGDVLVTTEIFSEKFCCDLSACRGRCCVEGDAGAPLTMEETAALEDAAETIRDFLSPASRRVIDSQGVAYADKDGDLVTSIVEGRECVFSGRGNLYTGDGVVRDCRFCLLEKACREGLAEYSKPVSCALYPVREKRLSNGMTALEYNRWDICAPAREKGMALDIPLYKFLQEALTRRFGRKWTEELFEVARVLPAEYYGQ